MKNKFLVVGLILVCLFVVKMSNGLKTKTISVLVFSKTNGWRHESIVDGKKALEFMARENNWTISFTEDSLQFNNKTLSKIDVIVLLNPTGKVWGTEEEKALMQYMKRGGGLAGIHSATDCDTTWPWYTKLIGGIFESHPPGTQMAQINVLDKTNRATKHLGDTWIRTDEWYNFRNLQPDKIVLLTLDESSYEGGTHGNNHPISWIKNYEGGRVFYTALGHTPQSYTEPLFLQHIKGGIEYAAGLK